MRALKIVLYATLAVAFLFMVFLQNTFGSGFRVSGGFDAVHRPGQPFLILQTQNFTFLSSQETGFGVGASYRVSRRGWDVGVGGVYLHDTNAVNGTNLNFLLDGGYTFSKFRVGIMHISNGRSLGIGPDDQPNDGWNLVTFGINY